MIPVVLILCSISLSALLILISDNPWTLLLKASATLFSLPLICLISKLNSLKKWHVLNIVFLFYKSHICRILHIVFVSLMFAELFLSVHHAPLHFRIDQNIIDKYYYELVQVLAENVVHQAHKCGWCVSDSERYD